MQIQIPLRWFHNRSSTVQQRHWLWTTTREIMRNPISEFLIHNIRQKYTSGKKCAKSETPYDQTSQQIFPGQKRQIFCNKKGSNPNPKRRQNFAIGIIITFLIFPPPHHHNWHHHLHHLCRHHISKSRRRLGFWISLFWPSSPSHHITSQPSSTSHYKTSQ